MRVHVLHHLHDWPLQVNSDTPLLCPWRRQLFNPVSAQLHTLKCTFRSCMYVFTIWHKTKGLRIDVLMCADIRNIPVQNHSAIKKKNLLPLLCALQAKGKLISCRATTPNNEREAVFLPVTPNRYLWDFSATVTHICKQPVAMKNARLIMFKQSDTLLQKETDKVVKTQGTCLTYSRALHGSTRSRRQIQGSHKK